MLSSTFKTVSSLALVGLLASCGNKTTSSGTGSAAPARQAESEAIATDGSNIQGYYHAIFETLNSQINGTLPGSTTILRKDDKIYFYLRLFAGMPKAWHPQGIYTGNRCPGPEDDLNGDGIIDIVEAKKAVGKLLIPLDADPGSQAGGRNFYPLGDLAGSYHYERIVNFKRFFDDLKQADRDPEDDLVKLRPDEGLPIEGQVVLVQGVAETTELPETVASEGRRRAFQTLPIACGFFKKSDGVPPGIPDDGEIPGPVADVEEGQDRPAPDDDWAPTPDGPRGPTGGTTNDSDRGETETRDEEGRRSGGRSTGGRTTGTTGNSGNTGSSGGSGTDNSGSGENSGSEDEGGETPPPPPQGG